MLLVMRFSGSEWRLGYWEMLTQMFPYLVDCFLEFLCFVPWICAIPYSICYRQKQQWFRCSLRESSGILCYSWAYGYYLCSFFIFSWYLGWWNYFVSFWRDYAVVWDGAGRIGNRERRPSFFSSLFRWRCLEFTCRTIVFSWYSVYRSHSFHISDLPYIDWERDRLYFVCYLLYADRESTVSLLSSLPCDTAGMSLCDAQQSILKAVNDCGE